MKHKSIIRPLHTVLVLLIGLLFIVTFLLPVAVNAAEESGSVGIEGRISAPPPTTPATISVPRNGQVFTELPISVSGICPNGLLIKLFKNNVFSGSTMCNNGSFTLQIDLFSGENELVVRVYDELDQAGPDSETIRVTFNDNRPGAGSRVTLTSNFAKRGANPGETLTWPVILSGGGGPYAISVDWGDGKAPDLISQPFPGPFTIQHIYDSPGVYNIIVKATDQSDGVAFLQLVGIANGPLSQESSAGTNNDDSSSGGPGETRILWQPAALLVPLLASTFWLGKKYELKMLRRRIEKGGRPF